MAVLVRRAVVSDQAAIEALVSGERLNPNGIEWPGFRVATHGNAVVGAVQMRRHRDGSRELGSLVVSWEYRGRGIASMLIESVLADQFGPVHVVTARAEATRYARWGFRSIAPAWAPRAVRRNFFLGQVMGGAVALLRGRAPRRLVILKRL